MALAHGPNNQVQGNPTKKAPRGVQIQSGTGISVGSNGSVSLPAIDDGDVMANTSGDAGAPVGTPLSDLLDHDITNVQGSIIVRDSTEWTDLVPGTSGYVLTSQGPAANLIWAPGSGGVTPANPTATAGPTAVNGVLTTYMRSDAAPAVQLGTNAQKGLVQVDGTSITASSGVISTPGGSNPTATASNVAVNGAALTFMRSDAAPAVQLCSSSVFGLAKPDNVSITASGGVISATGFVPLAAAFHPGFASGRFYTTPLPAVTATVSFATGKVHLTPFYVPSTTTFTKASVRSGTVSGTQKASMAIYANSAGQPTGAPLVQFGEVTLSSNATDEITGLTITLAPGWYWLGVGVDSTVTLASTATTELQFLFGQSTPNTLDLGYTMNWTYVAATLPTISGLTASSAAVALVYLRL